jgi:hypothetical protein
MGYAMGLDGRRILPPFLPNLRGEDAIFSLLIAHGMRDGLVARPPWAIAHLPGPRPQYAADRVWSATSSLGGPLRAIGAAIRLFPGCHAADDGVALRRLGEHLVDLAGLELDELDDVVGLALARQAGHEVTRLYARLATHGGAPAYWAEDVERAIDAKVAHLARRPWAFATPEEGEALRGALGRFGRLVAAWPELVALARALRDDGRALGREI